MNQRFTIEITSLIRITEGDLSEAIETIIGVRSINITEEE
jgi:hypothetical protein